MDKLEKNVMFIKVLQINRKWIFKNNSYTFRDFIGDM